MRISDWSSDVCSSDLIDNSRDPLLMNGAPAFGQEFDPAALQANNFIPVTALVRTSLFVAVGGFPQPLSEAWPHADCEDWGLWQRLLALGAKFGSASCRERGCQSG